MLVQVAVHHQSHQLVAFQGAQQLAQPVLERDGVNRELALRVAHRRRQPAIELHPRHRVQGVAPVGQHHRGELPVADVGRSEDHATPARDGVLEMLASPHLDRPQQLVPPQVRKPEELEQHAVVVAHHAAHPLQPLAARSSGERGREVGERGVTAFREEAKMKLGKEGSEGITETERKPRHEPGQPAENEPRHCLSTPFRSR